MFERFHQDARAAVVSARDEAVRAGQPAIGSEHVLLGLLAHQGSAAAALAAAGVTAAALREHIPHGGASGAGDTGALDADALASLGIDLDTVRRATDVAFGRGALDRAGQAQRGRRWHLMRMTPEAKRALEVALRLAVRRKDRKISSGHLLLGLIDNEDGPAVTSLRADGADIEALRADVLQRIAAAA